MDESLNLGDITKVDETKLPPFNIICFGSPCQDFSCAGHQAGAIWSCEECGNEYNPLTVHWSARGNCPQCNSGNIKKTRSSLLVEALRIIRHGMPNFGIYENVKAITSKKFKDTFQMFLDELHEYGYNTYYQVLNTKDFGIPQNRERLYLIFVKRELDNGKFTFPEPFDNGVRLKDILEDEVDDKYYVDTPRARELIEDLIASGKLDKDISNTVRGARKPRPQSSVGHDSSEQITGLFSKFGSVFDRETEFANTLLARDCKGFGNQSMNGVIDKIESKK